MEYLVRSMKICCINREGTLLTSHNPQVCVLTLLFIILN